MWLHSGVVEDAAGWSQTLEESGLDLVDDGRVSEQRNSIKMNTGRYG